jgi:NAD(P)-dependent dehydrogenase (short-subunit alcohol dehydrogenase family)
LHRYPLTQSTQLIENSHLGHFLFTIKLLPVLERTAEVMDSDVRVINVCIFILYALTHDSQVSSVAHIIKPPSTIRFDKISDFQYHGPSSSPPHESTRDLFHRYALSKLANILFTKALQKRYPNILCSSCNPGGTDTAGALSVWPPVLQPIMKSLFAAPAVGAKSLLFLAGDKDVSAEREKYKAVYLGSKCRIETPSQPARDAELAENLWKLSEEALAKWISQ